MTNLISANLGRIFINGSNTTLKNASLNGRLDGTGTGSTGTGGTLKVSGEFRVTDGVSSLRNGLTLRILQNASMIFDTTDLFLQTGAGLWNDGNFWWYSGTIHADVAELHGPTFENTGTFTILGDFSLVTTNAPFCSFLNTGTIRKQAGGGVANLAVWLTGPGVVDISAGAGSIQTANYLFGEGVTVHS